MIIEIAAVIEPFEAQVYEHADKLPRSNEMVQQALAYLSKMQELGAAHSDLEGFLAAAEQVDMFSIMKQYLTELAIEDMESEERSVEIVEPSVSEMAQIYHDSFKLMPNKESMPLTCHVYDEIFALEEESLDVSEFLKGMAENNLFVRLATMPLLDKNKQGDADVCLPATERHFKELAAAAQTATSALEVEYENLRLTEVFLMESMLDGLLMHDLFAGLYQALCAMEEKETYDRKEAVKREFKFVEDFFGVKKEEFFSIPRVKEFIAAVILPKEKEKKADLTLEAFITKQEELLFACLAEDEPLEVKENRKFVRFWGEDVPLGDILTEMKRPRRPLDYQS